MVYSTAGGEFDGPQPWRTAALPRRSMKKGRVSLPFFHERMAFRPQSGYWHSRL